MSSEQVKMDGIKFVKKAVTAEITEKKSRFIANLTPIGSEEEAAAFIASIKKKHYDARHNCYAYITGDVSKSSDDGEPAHTAGRPMMDILMREGLDNVCVVVTRYFGGILLGTGGLVRAYQGAVSEALKNAEFYSMTPMLSFKISCGYTEHGRISRYAEERGYRIENINWADRVSFEISIDPDNAEEFRENINRLTLGKFEMDEIGTVLK